MAKSKSAKKSSCQRTTISFKTKRGKTISFKGHTGPGCGPRKKPSTAHLKHYKTAFRAAARHCKGRPAGAFRNCMATQMPK